MFQSAEELLEGVAPESERLSVLLQVAATLGGTLELAPLLTSLLDRIVDVTPAARGTILLFDRPSRKLKSMVGKLRGKPAAEGANIPISRTIIREALRSREAILTMDAQTDARFVEGESIAEANMRSVLCVPIMRGDRILGAIHLDAASLGMTFRRDDVESRPHRYACKPDRNQVQARQVITNVGQRQNGEHC